MLIITLSYDTEKRTGAWGVMSGDQAQVSLLEVAQALAWAQWDVLAKLAAAQIKSVEVKDEKA